MQKYIALCRLADGAYRDARANCPPRRRPRRRCVCLRESSRHQPRRPTSRVVAFDGARLITGDGSAAIESPRSWSRAAGSRPSGASGQVAVPAAAARVDVSGKTIVPALIDAHAHIGYMRDLTSGPQNYTRENIVDHLQRYAYFGAAAVQAMGSDFTDLPYQLRDESGAGRIPDAARFLTAGRGLAPPDEVRPDNMRHAAYTITTEQEARAAVAELADRGVAIVKTWVDDRGGAVRKLTPALYGAMIDEAHRRGLRVMVHATVARRRQGAAAGRRRRLRSCLPGSGRRAARPDQGTGPQVFFLLALGGPRRIVSAPWLRSGASAGPGNGVAGADCAAAAAARPPVAGRSSTGPGRLGADGGGHRPHGAPPAR